MNTPTPTQTGSRIDQIYAKAESYKKAAKVLSIISYAILLLGVVGFISFASFGYFGALVGLYPVVIGFILWIPLQLAAEILRIASRKKLSAVPGAVDSEMNMLKARNKRNYIIFFACMAVIGGALVATVLLNQ